jgi:hypothetical protein
VVRYLIPMLVVHDRQERLVLLTEAGIRGLNCRPVIESRYKGRIQKYIFI